MGWDKKLAIEAGCDCKKFRPGGFAVGGICGGICGAHHHVNLPGGLQLSAAGLRQQRPPPGDQDYDITGWTPTRLSWYGVLQVLTSALDT